MENSKSDASKKTKETKRFSDTLKEYKAEFGKISWPNKTELYKQTLTVIVTTLFSAVIISAMDIGISNTLKFVAVQIAKIL